MKLKSPNSPRKSLSTGPKYKGLKKNSPSMQLFKGRAKTIRDRFKTTRDKTKITNDKFRPSMLKSHHSHLILFRLILTRPPSTVSEISRKSGRGKNNSFKSRYRTFKLRQSKSPIPLHNSDLETSTSSLNSHHSHRRTVKYRTSTIQYELYGYKQKFTRELFHLETQLSRDFKAKYHHLSTQKAVKKQPSSVSCNKKIQKSIG